MNALPTSFFGWVGFILEKYGTLFLSGVGITLLVAITGTIIGFAIGLLVAILRTIPVAPRAPWYRRLPLRALSALLNVYIEVFRGTPMIVQAMVIYYGCMYMGLRMPVLVAAVLTPPDVVSQLMLAIPMCLLYELGIIAAAAVTKKPGIEARE